MHNSGDFGCGGHLAQQSFNAVIIHPTRETLDRHKTCLELGHETNISERTVDLIDDEERELREIIVSRIPRQLSALDQCHTKRLTKNIRVSLIRAPMKA